MGVWINEWVNLSAMTDRMRERVKALRSRVNDPGQKKSLQAVIVKLESFEKYCNAVIDDMTKKDADEVVVKVGEVNLPGKEDEELWSSDMSIRCVNLLLKGGFKTFGDLEKVEGYELLKIVGLGRKTLDEIRSCMRSHGYYFATEGRMLRGE